MKFYKHRKITIADVSETRCDYCFEKTGDKKVELVMRPGYHSDFDTIGNVCFDICDACFARLFGQMYKNKQKLDREQPANWKEAEKILKSVDK